MVKLRFFLPPIFFQSIFFGFICCLGGMLLSNKPQRDCGLVIFPKGGKRGQRPPHPLGVCFFSKGCGGYRQSFETQPPSTIDNHFACP